MARAMNIQLPLLQDISRIPFEDQGICIANLKVGALNTICKCLRQILNGNGPMRMNEEDTGRLRGYLKPYRSKLKIFVAPETTLLQKRKLLRKKGGALFSVLLAAVLPLIISKIVGLVSKKKKT